ncbi:MAG: hypothetical protein M3R15_02655 [Acidobacteriota bacterium]|nr:hypothetical protein [Acidobacteriota bacterium]
MRVVHNDRHRQQVMHLAVWPTHARITVGTREEMAKFKAALLKVTNS